MSASQLFTISISIPAVRPTTGDVGRGLVTLSHLARSSLSPAAGLCGPPTRHLHTPGATAARRPLTVALPAVRAQLVAGVAHALVGPPGVEAAVGTLRLPRGTFVHVWVGEIKAEPLGCWPGMCSPRGEAFRGRGPSGGQGSGPLCQEAPPPRAPWHFLSHGSTTEAAHLSSHVFINRTRVQNHVPLGAGRAQLDVCSLSPLPAAPGKGSVTFPRCATPLSPSLTGGASPWPASGGQVTPGTAISLPPQPRARPRCTTPALVEPRGSLGCGCPQPRVLLSGPHAEQPGDDALDAGSWCGWRGGRSPGHLEKGSLPAPMPRLTSDSPPELRGDAHRPLPRAACTGRRRHAPSSCDGVTDAPDRSAHTPAAKDEERCPKHGAHWALGRFEVRRPTSSPGDARARVTAFLFP